jgi:two-component system chemotaxis response regulator CheB
MAGHDIIVIGASSGGIESLISIARGLPADLPASVFVVLHIPAQSKSSLPQILTQAGPLRAVHPENNEAIEPGRIYVAPPDCHLMIDDGHVRLVRGPRENHHRPAVDPLFRTAARFYGPRVVGVVLSGALDDGSAGLVAVKSRGGVAVVQDPAEALFPDMPRNAMEAAGADYCVAKTQIAPLLVRLASEKVALENSGLVTGTMKKETKIEAMDMSAIDDENRPGKPSVFGCPDCGGTLWELETNELLRFRCRVGHAFGSDGLLARQSEALDDALWAAFRALQENASLARRLAERSRQQKSEALAQTFDERAEIAAARSEVIRALLLSNEKADDAAKR